MKKCSMALLCPVAMAATLAYAQSAEGFQMATVVSIDKVALTPSIRKMRTVTRFPKTPE
jgi:hypothetical protein